jgi:hypothetical protein
LPGLSAWVPAPVDEGWRTYLRTITDDYPWDPDRAVDVMMCESGGNNDSYSPYGPYYGAWQIDFYHENWDDLIVNTSVAYFNKYVPAGGWAPWPNC